MFKYLKFEFIDVLISLFNEIDCNGYFNEFDIEIRDMNMRMEK